MPEGPSFWFDTRVYLGVAATLLLIVTFYNPYLAILGAILLYVLYLYGRERYLERQKAFNSYLESMTYCIDRASMFALEHLPLAIAMVDEKGRVDWHNCVFSEWTGKKFSGEDSIYSIWPEIPLAKWWGSEEKSVFHTGNKHYRVVHTTLIDKQTGKERLLLYFMDITEQENIKLAYQAATPVFGYIQIDNLADVLQGLTESQRTAILSEVNQKLVAWITQADGFLKKYTDDTYFAVLNKKSLDKIMAEKFDILDTVRAVRSGNKIPVTLSMGVAADDYSPASLGQKAQAGLDLALGRGGDQAAVNIGGKVLFYGGKTKAVEKNTRVKARVVSQALRELIGEADLVLAMGHISEDYDSLGAALGVTKMARSLGKKTHVVISEPGSAVEKLKNLLAEYDKYQDVTITASQSSTMLTPRTILFVVDTHRPELVAVPELLGKVDRVIVIDHHRRSEDFIHNPFLVYLEPSASSASELVTELLMYFDDKIDLTRLEASALYAGIIVDTKNFNDQTGVRTFEAASYLRRAGADPSLVRQMFRVDFETAKARAEIIKNAKTIKPGILLAVFSRDIKNGHIVAAQSADMLLNIEGSLATFVLFPIDGGVGISARSNGTINVQLTMEQFGGGGHQTMAGAQIKGASLEEVEAKIVQLISDYGKGE